MITRIFPLGFTRPGARIPGFQQDPDPGNGSCWRFGRVSTLPRWAPCEIMLFIQGRDMPKDVVEESDSRYIFSAHEEAKQGSREMQCWN